MQIIPAIDIVNKKVVRLSQGGFDREKVYSDDPVLVAKEWKRQGARLLHVVDLDGARLGKPKNTDVVADIAKEAKIDIEFGGGLRSEEDIESAFNAGVRFVVVGTSAVIDEAFCGRVAKKFGKKVIFAVDVKDSRVAVKGWKELSKKSASGYIVKLEALGAGRIIYTDITRDGMMAGPNREGLESVLDSTALEVVASGGISSIEDIRVLKKLESKGLVGVILGKALYEGKIDLEEAIRVS